LVSDEPKLLHSTKMLITFPKHWQRWWDELETRTEVRVTIPNAFFLKCFPYRLISIIAIAYRRKN